MGNSPNQKSGKKTTPSPSPRSSTSVSSPRISSTTGSMIRSMEETSRFFFQEGREKCSQKLQSTPHAVPFFVDFLFSIRSSGEINLDQLLEWCMWIALGQDPVAFFKEKAEHFQSKTCNTSWKEGGMAYRCTDCQTTDSSSMCIQCFKDGNHEGHDYTLYRSQFGGCCDCGNADLWKPSGFCKTHVAAAASSLDKQQMKYLPASRATIRAILVRLVPQLKHHQTEKVFLTGVLKWLQDVASISEDFKRLLAEEILKPFEDQKPNVLVVDFFLEVIPKLSDDVGMRCVDLLLELTVGIDHAQGSLLLAHHVQHFPFYAQESALKEEDDRKLIEALIHRVSAQLAILPDLCEPVARQGLLLEPMLEAIFLILTLASEEKEDFGQTIYTVNPADKLISSEVLLPFLSCFESVMKHKGCAYHMLYGNPKLFRRWLQCVQCFQGMSGNKRKTDTHVEYESDTWISGMYLEIIAILPQEIPNAFRNGKELDNKSNCWVLVLQECLQSISQWTHSQLTQERLFSLATSSASLPPRPRPLRELDSLFPEVLTSSSLSELSPVPSSLSSHQCFDSSRQNVFLNLPLHRTLAQLLSEIVEMNLDPIFVDNLLSLSPPKIWQLAEYPLRIFVMSSQIRAEMWNRNGVSTMKGQMNVYMSALFSYWMLDADLFLLQYACCVMSNDDVIALLLEYFGVQRWLAKPKTITPLTKEENVLTEDVLTLVMKLVSDRSYLGASDDDLLRRELIHWLATGDLSASKLLDKLPEPLKTLIPAAKIDKILAEISTPQNPKHLKDQRTHHLNTECWNEFDPYFVHYRPSDLQKAEENYKRHLERMKNASGSNAAGKKNTTSNSSGILPVCAKLSPIPNSFKRLLGLLESPLLHFVIFSILRGALVSPQSGVSETLLNVALHMCRVLSLYATENLKKEVLSPSAASSSSSSSASSYNGHTVYTSRDFLSNVSAEISPIISEPKESLLQILVRIQQDNKYQDQRSTVDQILETLCSAEPKLSEIVRKLSNSAKPTENEDNANWNKKAARDRQKAMLEKMAAQRQTFLQNTKLADLDIDDENEDEANESTESEQTERWQCAVCKETQEATASHHRAMVLLSCVQRSRLLSLSAASVAPSTAAPSSPEPENLERALSRNPQPALDQTLIAQLLGLLPPAEEVPAVVEDVSAEQQRHNEFPQCKLDSPTSPDPRLYLTSCGHTSHADCFAQYYRTSTQDTNRQHSSRDRLLSIVDREFFCPVCRRLGNVLIPLVPTASIEGFLESNSSSKPKEQMPVPGIVREGTEESTSTAVAVSEKQYERFLGIPSSATSSSSCASSDDDEPPVLEDHSTANATLFAGLEEMAKRVYYAERHNEATGARLLLPLLMTTCASTIAAMELSMRPQLLQGDAPQGSVLATLTKLIKPEQLTALRSFARSIFVFAHQFVPPSTSQQLEEKIRRTFLWTTEEQNSAVLSDCFLALVHWSFMGTETLFNGVSGGRFFHYVRSVFSARLLQSISALEPPTISRIATAQKNSWKTFAEFRAECIGNEIVDISDIRKQTIPFLRRAILFAHFCLRMPLVSPNSTESDRSGLIDEFETYRAVLRLPTFDAIVSSTAQIALLKKWCSVHLSTRELVPPRVSTSPLRLIDLPLLYQDLLHKHVEAKCASCHTAIPEPALCLLCGAVVRREKPCCGPASNDAENTTAMGGCLRHAIRCNGGQGAFIFVKQCVTVLIHDVRSTLIGSPYLDSRGEEDPGLRRGKPLRFDLARYRELEQLVVSQLVDEQILQPEANHSSRQAQF